MVDNKGLTQEEAEKRLKTNGYNELRRKKRADWIKILISQFTSPFIFLLILAAVISYGVGFLPEVEGDVVDSVLILIIVLVSGGLGFLQDYKAEKTIEALQGMMKPKAKVIRDGVEMEILAREIVPGDLVILDEGDVIPADCKIIESFSLQINEAPLTGESLSVGKNSGDQAYMNTFINSGSAKAVVTKTGRETKVGRIAEKLEEVVEEKTAFEEEINKFSKKILFLILGLIIVMTIFSMFKFSLYTSILTSIALAVAAIPEGLPAVIVLTFALGAKEMSRRKALIRRMSVTESIGAVDVICTDKTGTITENNMAVVKLSISGKDYDVEKINDNGKKWIDPLMIAGSLCNKSSKGMNGEKKGIFMGDPTEIAIRRVSDKFGFIKEDLEEKYQKASEIPFNSRRKMSTFVYHSKEKGFKYVAYTKGAPEVVLDKCKSVYINGVERKLTSSARKKIIDKNNEFASQGLRVIGFAYKKLNFLNNDIEEDLVFLGLEAMMDPPRKEVKEALKKCKTAGIRVMMLTGDNAITAESISKKVGLKSKGVIVGSELDDMSDSEIKKALDSGVNIFARVSPFHKLRILEILQKEKRVAMTGDGVNDALALKRADVGVSMGIRGTEVAKQASDIILLDDNFATIVESVKEGRRIFDNIKKFASYLFVSNMAEVLVIFIATLFLSLKEPILLPVQILWINLLTDGLPALALGVDPAKPGIMEKKPRKRGTSVIDKQLGISILAIGVLKTAILFVTFFLIIGKGFEEARTALFTGFVLYEFVRIGAIRYQEKLKWFSNKWLLAALAVSLALQIGLVYSPVGRFLSVVPLSSYSWIVLIGGIVIGFAGSILISHMVVKYYEKDH